MLSQRNRPIFVAAVSLAAVWLLAWGGYTIAQNSKMTPEKVRAFLHETDLKSLSGDARAKRLRRLADMLNGLTGEDRRLARMDGMWNKVFAEMSDQEKLEFLDETLPSGVKQMLDSFEKLDIQKRARAIADATRRLREARENPEMSQGTNGPPADPPTPEMQKRLVTTGLNTFYKESSAQTKAEMAPLLEEIQRSMESGQLFRPQR